MSRYRSLHCHFPTVLKPGYSPCDYCVTFSRKSSFLSSLFRSLRSFSLQFDEGIGAEVSEAKKKKRLDDMFKEAVGLSPLVENSDSESENGDSEVKRKLRDLERSIKKLKSNSKTEEIPKAKDLSEGEPMKLSALSAPQKGHKAKDLSEGEPMKLSALSAQQKGHKAKDLSEGESMKLSALFAQQKGHKAKDLSECEPMKLSALFAPQKGHLKKPEERSEDRSVCKKFSLDMEVFVRHLYVEGYFNNANLLPDNKLDFTCFKSSYARGLIKSAAESFGRDNQEIAKSLSCSDLKKIALFGCPSLERKSVFAAKILRKFFEIQEDTVCSKCVLKQSCKFSNQSVWNDRDKKNLSLSAVMKVISVYALESVHPQLAIPDDVKTSVSRVLKEILTLSQTVS